MDKFWYMDNFLQQGELLCVVDFCYTEIINRAFLCRITLKSVESMNLDRSDSL